MVELFDPTFKFGSIVNKERVDGEENIDFFDPKVTDLVRRIDRADTFTYVYDGSEQIENIAFKFYYTTSIWWLIMEYNGFTHPLELEEGQVLRMPAKSDIDRIMSDNLPKNRRGRRRLI